MRSGASDSTVPDRKSFRLKVWLEAFRLRTLSLAISSILVGSALAHFRGWFDRPVFLLTLLTAVLLQILSNLANDLGDHQHGTDNADRIGPARSVQSGAITAAAMQRAMLIAATLAFLSGLWLIIMVFGLSLMMIGFLLLGLLAIGAAVKYTFGSNPYGYAGFGDIAVFVFFGLVGVIGTFHLHTLHFDKITVLPAIAFGLLSAGVLNVNNMRDIRNDAASGKRTLAVRLGPQRAKILHVLSITVAIVLLVLSAIAIGGRWTWLYAIGTVPIVLHLIKVWRNTDPHKLDPELKRLALGTFATAITFSIGLYLT